MAIKIENLYKSYQDKQVLENLNMELAEGQITCIMAPSGKRQNYVTSYSNWIGKGRQWQDNRNGR